MSTFYKLAAVVLLAGMAGHRYLMVRKSPAVEAYHERVRTAAAGLPTRIGPWVGEDTPVPVQATTVLRPNVMLSRRYTNVETGLVASFVLVHCADAHDMAGHFPLRCYPAQGWEAAAGRERDWAAADDLVLTGSEYEFRRDVGGDSGGGGQHAIVVANALLRPGNTMYREMGGLTRSILGAGGQAAGAGQLQVVFDATVPEGQRDEAVRALVAGHRPVMDAILASIGQK